MMGQRIFNQARYDQIEDDLDPGPKVKEYIPPYFVPISFGKAGQIQIMEDGSFGIIWKIGVPPVETMANGDALVSAAVSKVLAAIPSGFAAQIIPMRTSNIAKYIDAYLNTAGKNEAAKLFAEETAQRWLDARKDGFFPDSPDINFKPVDQDIVITLRTEPYKWAGSLKLLDSLIGAVSLKHIEKKIDKRLSDKIRAFNRTCRTIERQITAVGLAYLRADANELLAVIQKMFFPDRDRRSRAPVYRQGDVLGDTVASLGPIGISDGGIKTGNTYFRMITMTTQPSAYYSGMVSELVSEFGDIMIVANIHVPNQALAVAGLKVQSFIGSRMQTAFNKIESQEAEESMQLAQTRAYRGEKMLSVMYGVIVQGTTEDEADDMADRVCGFLRARNMEANVETTIGANTILHSYPLAQDKKINFWLARHRRLLSTDLADILPLGGAWEGITKNLFDKNDALSDSDIESMPPVMYASRWGNPLFINPALAESNPHFLIAGGSGSGKSFFVHDYIKQMWRLNNVRATLISIKPDYKKLANLLGKYVEIDLDNPVSINPFGGKPTKANQAFWTTALIQAITQGKNTNEVDKIDEELLSSSALQASQENYDEATDTIIRETLLKDILTVLRTKGQKGELLAQKMRAYETGQFSKLVDSPREIKDDDRFIFFNLAKLSGMQCQGFVVLSLFHFINDIMYDPKLVGVKKLIGIDEIWSLLKDGYSADFLDTSFRAYRSLGGQAFAISQRMADYDSPVGQVILANTATKFVLPQSESEMEKLGNYIPVSKNDLALIRSLQLRKRYYGEFYVSMEGMPSTVGRVVPDPLSYALSSTEPTDTAIYNKLLLEENNDNMSALKRFVREYPYGIKAA
ncbi:VirB4 family type IV secretion system protein [Acidithiobacillus marinus]|nr:TraC family protein [Acidithiobacillus marinus]